MDINKGKNKDKTYDRFDLFRAKKPSGFMQQWRAVSRLIPKKYRQTHNNFHLYYEALCDKPGGDFCYTMFACNKKTGIYEKVISLVLPHGQNTHDKGDGVDGSSIFSKSSSPMWAKWMEKLSQWTPFPGVYELEYYPAKDAIYNLNRHNADYLYELVSGNNDNGELSKLSDNESIFDRVIHGDRSRLIKHQGIMEFEKHRGTLRFYLFSEETRKEMLKDKSNVLYFADESNYKLKDIYEQTDKALLEDADVAMRFMIIGAMDFHLPEKFKDNPDFMLEVAQNQWLFGKGKKIKNNSAKHNKDKDEYLYHNALGREDFMAFFPNFQRHCQVAVALKQMLGENVLEPGILDEIYQTVIPEKYRLMIDGKDETDMNDATDINNVPELIVNWQKRNMVTWAFQTFVKDALFNRYIQVHQGEIKGMYPANYQDSRFCDLEVSYPDIFLNTHDRDFLMTLSEDEKACMNEMLNIHAPDFKALMDDKEFLLTQKIGSEDVKYLSENSRCDPAIAIHAVQSLPTQFYNRVSLNDFKELGDNRDVVHAFCCNDVKNFAYAKEDLRKNKDFVMSLIGQTMSQNRQKCFSGIYHYTHESLKQDKEVAMFAIKHGQTLHDVPEPIKTEELQYESLLINLHNYHFTTTGFRNKPENEEFAIKAFAQDKNVYALLPASLKARRDLAESALFDKVSLEHFANEFKDDLEMVLIALAIEQNNYRHISERLRDDEALLMIATTHLATLKADGRYSDYLKKMNRKDMLLLNPFSFDNTENVQYASNRLQQRFGTNWPYEYLKKEEQVNALAQKLETQYGSKDKDRDKILEEKNTNNSNESYSRPMKI